jgi:hypothetical protein
METEQTNKTALVGGSRVNNAHWTQKIWDPYCVLRFWLSSVEDGVLAGSPLAVVEDLRTLRLQGLAINQNLHLGGSNTSKEYNWSTRTSSKSVDVVLTLSLAGSTPLVQTKPLLGAAPACS